MRSFLLLTELSAGAEFNKFSYKNNDKDDDGDDDDIINDSNTINYNNIIYIVRYFITLYTSPYIFFYCHVTYTVNHKEYNSLL